MSLLPLTQDVTFWATNGSDANGDPIYKPPSSIKARWVRKDGVFTDNKGNDHKTEYAIYATVYIPKRSMVVLAIDVSLTPINGSRLVFSSIENPSMTNLKKYVM